MGCVALCFFIVDVCIFLLVLVCVACVCLGCCCSCLNCCCLCVVDAFVWLLLSYSLRFCYSLMLTCVLPWRCLFLWFVCGWVGVALFFVRCVVFYSWLMRVIYCCCLVSLFVVCVCLGCCLLCVIVVVGVSC